MRIMIDPGHGGRDPGAVARGLKESDIAMVYADALHAEFVRRHHVAALTRNGDVDLALQGMGWPEPGKGFDLNERCRRANAFGATAFISLHCNAAARTDANGAWMLYANGSARGLDLARRIFHKLKQIPGIPDADPADEVYPDGSPATGYTGAAVRLLRKRPPGVAATDWLARMGLPRDQWYRTIRVLRGTKMPAVLNELGFLTNAGDTVQLVKLETRTAVVNAIADAVEEWEL